MPYRDYTWDEDRWNDTEDEVEIDIYWTKVKEYKFKENKMCKHCGTIIFFANKTLRCPNCGKTI